MFFDGAFSQLGRKSEEHLHGLRKQLGIGVDPAFDYTEIIEQAKQVSKKPEKKPDGQKQDGQKEILGSDDKGPLSGIEQLRRVLKDVVGANGMPEEGGGAEEASNEAALKSGDDKLSPAQVRAQREKFRPTSSFLAVHRRKRAGLDSNNRDRAPPLGTYRPQDDFCRPRLTRDVDFGLKTPHKSLRAKATESRIAQLKEDGKPYDHLVRHTHSVELSEEFPPEGIKGHTGVFDLGKAPAHNDPTKNAVPRGKLEFNTNSFTAGVLDGDLSCSHTCRNPFWDFEKTLKEPPQHKRDTYFQPGQYRCNLESVRPKLMYTTTNFEKQRERKPIKNTDGLIDVKDQPGHHLPDRSLARSCPLLKQRIAVPDISKGTKRPDHFKPADGYVNKSDPEARERVYQHDLTYDVSENSKVLGRRARTAESFDNSLTREDEVKRTRNFHNSISLVRTAENLKKGAMPHSVELLPDVDGGPSLKTRMLLNMDFHQMGGRETEKRYTESPSRHRDQGKATKFERDVRAGDLRADAQALSPLAGNIMGLRATRTWQALPVGEHDSV